MKQGSLHSALTMLCLLMATGFSGLLTSAQAQPGDALDFDGSNQYVSTNLTISFSQSDNKSYTFSAWVKLDATDGNTEQILTLNDGSYDWAICKGEDNDEWEMFVGTNGLSSGTNNATNNVLSSGVSTDQSWHFITGVFDRGDDEARIYVDGVLENSSDLGYGSSSNNINVARNPNGQEYFEGDIDEVRIWSEARSQTEIQNHMHQELDASSHNNLEAYYVCNAGSGTTLSDQTSNGNDGTLQNMNNSSNWVTSNAALTDNSKIQGGSYSNDPAGIWPSNTSASSSGLTVSENTNNTLNSGDNVVVGHEGSTGQNTSPNDNDYDFSSVSASSLDAVAKREWFVDENAGGKNVDLTFNTNNAGIGGFGSGSASDYVLIEVNSNSDDELIKTATSVDASANEISFTDVSINSTYTFGTTDDQNSTLPVELTSFEAEQGEDRSADLTWSTASETNNRHFLIQRRAGDQWQEIGQVEGNGTTTVPQDYQFTDNNPQRGTNYYRLKQVDYDGSHEFSDVRAVSISGDRTAETTQLALYPNPVADQLNVKLAGAKRAAYTVVIRTSRGQVVYRDQLTLSNDDAGQTLPVSNLKPGAYVLMLKGADKAYQQRFIKR